MSINKRIKEIIISKENGKNAAFADRIGKSRQQVSNIIKDGASVGLEIVNNIMNVYPDINTDWLLTGEGEMLRKKVRNEAVFVEKEIMYVPLVGKYAYAGYLSGYGDDEYVESLPTLPFPVDHQGRGNYLCFEVKGDSMDDESSAAYKEGEILLCREIHHDYWQQSKLHIRKWDFVIVHKEEGVLVKEIIDHDVERGLITIHSRNHYYPDMVLKLKDVRKIFNVVSSLKPRDK